MAWTRNSASAWVHSGSSLEAVVSAQKMPAEAALRYQIPSPHHVVGVRFRGSQDLRTCYEAVFDAGTGGNVIIRKNTFGVAGSALATAAHGLTDGIPFTITVRVLASGRFEVYLNGATSPIITYNAGSDLKEYAFYGFASAFDGAVVQIAEICQLVPVVVPASQVLVAIAGGELWASTNGETIARISANAVKSDGVVSAAEFEQKLYIVDGSNARIYDPAAASVSKWTPSAGSLPGANASLGIDTTASVVVTHVGCLWLAGMKDDPQNWKSTAIDDPLDLDEGAAEIGRAMVGSNERAGIVGRPIRGLLPYSDNTMLFMCDTQVWRMTGHPAFGGQLLNVTYEAGGTGPRCGVSGNGGSALVLTEKGLASVGAEGTIRIFSQDILTDYVVLGDNAGDYTVLVERDPSRFGVHVFITPISSTAATHLWFDERLGGFFPETYPLADGPTACVRWGDKVVLGTRDGYLMVFDDTQKDDHGTAIDALVALDLVADGGTTFDTLIHETRIELGQGSDPVGYRIRADWTPETAYTGPVRAGGIARAGRTLNLRTVRDAGIVLELFSNTAGQTWSFERVDVDAELVPRLSPKRRSVTPAPAYANTGSSGTGTSSASGSGTSFGTGSGGTGTGTGTGTGSGTGTATGSGTGSAPSGGGGSGSGIPPDGGGSIGGWT